MSGTKTFRVKIRDTDNILFDGNVDRISSFNEVGPFDVYPMHANFISIIKNALVLYNNKAKVKEIKFEQAVMKVKKDVAQVFLGIEGFLLEEERIANPHSTSTASESTQSL